MYDGVPITEPASRVRIVAEPLRAVAMTVCRRSASRHGVVAIPPRGNTLASPQSMTWTSPKEPTITFDGFRSR